MRKTQAPLARDIIRETDEFLAYSKYQRMPENPESELGAISIVAPVDPREFKFCFVLMNATHTEKIPSWTESQDAVLRDGDEVAKLRLRRTPLNDGLIAVNAHYRQTRSDWHTGHHEFRAMTTRLIEFLKVVKECLRKGDGRIAKYLRVEYSGITTIEPALAEAAATVDFGPNGFDISSMFGVADALSSQEMPICMTSERKPKKNPNGGRPPSMASPEQLVEWQNDMERRACLRKGKKLPPELRRSHR